jgi:hypothetical protein
MKINFNNWDNLKNIIFYDDNYVESNNDFIIFYDDNYLLGHIISNDFYIYKGLINIKDFKKNYTTFYKLIHYKDDEYLYFCRDGELYEMDFIYSKDKELIINNTYKICNDFRYKPHQYDNDIIDKCFTYDELFDVLKK